MSALLALAAAMAGTAFDCEVVTRRFSLFAPAEEVTANYRGNVLTLYRLEVEEDGFGEGVKLDQVFDGLPYELFVALDNGSDAPTEITIFELDEEKGVARAQITDDISPMGGGTTRITLEGTCSFTRSDGKEGA